MPYVRGALWDRFWSKVDIPDGPFKDDQCWLWIGAQSRKRSGTTRGVVRSGSTGSRVVLAHRLALSFASMTGETHDLQAVLDEYDQAFADGTPRHAAHRTHCTSRLCCNPRHLYWATPQENHADRYGRRDDASQPGQGPLQRLADGEF